MCGQSTLPSITENNSLYQSLIRRKRDQGFKIYKLKGNLLWLRVLQTVYNIYFYYYFIIRDEFEFNDLEYCVLISVLNLNNFTSFFRDEYYPYSRRGKEIKNLMGHGKGPYICLNETGSPSPMMSFSFITFSYLFNCIFGFIR